MKKGAAAAYGITVNREEKLLELKKKLAWTCCENLLSPPIAKLERLELDPESTDEERAHRQEEYAMQSRAIEKERQMREPELLGEFENIIDRVRSATANYQGTQFSYTAVSEAFRATIVRCERCNSDVG